MERSVFLTKPHQYLEKELYFRFCGIAQTLPLHSFGPAVRDSYVLHVVLSGQGSYRVKGKQFFLREGSLFLIRPGESTFYVADRTSPWVYAWLCFSGSVADALVSESDFGSDAYTAFTANPAAYVDIIKDCLTFEEDTLTNELRLTELTYRFLRTLLSDALQQTAVASHSLSDLTQGVIKYVEAHYFEEVTIQGIAKELSVHRSHLSRCFKQDTGSSIQHWLLTVRVNKAAFLLSSTDETVSAIAFYTGFNSLVSFSRAFRSLTEESPSSYRRRCLNTRFDPTALSGVMTHLKERPLASRST